MWEVGTHRQIEGAETSWDKSRMVFSAWQEEKSNTFTRPLYILTVFVLIVSISVLLSFSTLNCLRTFRSEFCNKN